MIQTVQKLKYCMTGARKKKENFAFKYHFKQSVVNDTNDLLRGIGDTFT